MGWHTAPRGLLATLRVLLQQLRRRETCVTGLSAASASKARLQNTHVRSPHNALWFRGFDIHGIICIIGIFDLVVSQGKSTVLEHGSAIVDDSQSAQTPKNRGSDSPDVTQVLERWHTNQGRVRCNGQFGVCE